MSKTDNISKIAKILIDNGVELSRWQLRSLLDPDNPIYFIVKSGFNNNKSNIVLDLEKEFSQLFDRIKFDESKSMLFIYLHKEQ